MGLTTDFNQAPYFDDYDRKKNYHRILFKPALALQARELTQLQTILQNQIERFGDNVLTEGTIVRGGNFVEETKLFYAKIRDISKNPSFAEVPTDINQYVGLKAVGQQNGVEAIIVATEYGLETQSPDLSTLFLKYTATGTNDAKQFVAGEEVWLYSQDSNGDYTIQFHLVTIAPASVDPNGTPVGRSYGVRCGNGVIYQKGHFVRFEDGLTIVSKYDNKPDGVVVGFQTNEYIIDSNADSSLLDNASGFNNERAPGADRLQLIPELVVLTLDEAEANDTFFAIQEYANGKVVRRNVRTQYNKIADEMERRTNEESGDYVIDRFKVRTAPNKIDPTKLTAYISAGLGYIDGKRIELLNEIGLDVPDATATRSVANQNVNANYGRWVSVAPTTIEGDGDPIMGYFNFMSMETVNLKNASNVTIGTARIKALIKRSDTEYRIYLATIKMSTGQNFKSTRRIVSSTSSGDATINLVGGNAILQDSKFSKSLFPIGKSFIKEVDSAATNFIYRASETKTVATNSFILTLTGNNNFPYAAGALTSDQLLDIVVIANAAQGGVISQYESLDIASASLDATGKQLTVNLVKAITASISLTISYTARATNVVGNAKTLKTVYVKINTTSAGTSGNYSLGMPDVYSLEGVWLGDSSAGWTALETAATNNTSSGRVTSYFRLVSGQTDDYYDHSRIRLKRALGSLDATSYLIAKVKVFHRAATGNFVSVNNYPIDDVTVPLPTDAIRTESIPTFTASDGTEYDLRDVIDLRPYVTATAAYAETASAATINPASTIAFTNTVYPAPNQIIDTAFTFYLGRNDNIIIDKNGEFVLVKGKPAPNPTSPPDPRNGMLVAKLFVPPFPTLDADSANKIGKPHYGVAIKSNQTQRYTMKDIGDIDQRIKNLEYYTSLSLLENSAKDFMVTDASGANRFKNGIFVDNFENFALAKVRDGQFAASIDASEKTIAPKIRQFPLGLKWKSGTGARRYSNKIAALNKTDVRCPSASQPYATAVKNCTTNFWNYTGRMAIIPEYDFGVDTTTAPAVDLELDLATPFIEYTELLGELVPLIRRRTTSSTTVSGVTQTVETLINQITANVSVGETLTQDLGDFVTDLQIKPYMRGKRIQIKCSGIRPNTRVYFFFDGVNVDQYVARAKDYNPDGSTTHELSVNTSVDNTQATNTRMVVKSSAFGAAVKSDASGIVRAIFKIPKNTFFVGSRKLEILDVNDLADRDAATTSAQTTYNAFNYSVTSTSVEATTRMPSFETSETSEATTSISTIGGAPTNEGMGRDPGPQADPLAQTFIFDTNTSSDTHVFLTKVDVYFAKKSRAGNGVTVQIREVNNGYPGSRALPFSTIRIPAAAVIAPTTSIATNALTPTTVRFEAPIALKTGKEYALVISPEANDPDYLVWIARTGERDIDTNVAIRQDVNAGVLFTSTNNRTWTPYQNENLKFKLYAANFESTGTVTLTNNDHEFFYVSSVTDEFDKGEEVIQKKTSFLTGTVSVTEDSATVTGSGTAFLTEYAADENIVIVNGTSYEVYKINTINSNTSITIRGVAQTTLSGKSHYKSPVGDVIYYNANDPAMLILEESDAKVGMQFADGDTVLGINSGATASIDLTTLGMSYIQPMINRLNFTKTDLSIDANLRSSVTGTMVGEDLRFGATTYLTDDKYVIRSKSTAPASNQFELVFNMSNTSTTVRDTSPIVDFDASSVMIGQYIVNSSTTDSSERESLGDADARYISKVIQLADGMDAEDIRVILGAYKPVATDIKVYAKFQADTDSRDFSEIEWTRLYIKPETDSVSSTANRNDWREYEYTLGTTALGDGLGAWDNSGTINYKDDDGALYTSYKYFAVKIVMLANSYNVVPRLKDLRVLALS